MRRFVTFGPALVVLFAALATLVAAPAAVREIGYASTDATVQLARRSLDQSTILEQINQAVGAIAEAVEPTVVHIQTPERRGMVRRSQGSGWVYDARGHIVTNAHVVAGWDEVKVQFYDGRRANARVVGTDPQTDIAVIKVAETEGLVASVRASGSELLQGDRVYAFGSPFGFKFSMSEGIVSGLGRDPSQVIGYGGYTNFIQSDAAVNPGNSGGPLVDVNGRVVGMNVAIATASDDSSPFGGQSAGISFAIPLETIESRVEQIINGGEISRGFLGITQPGKDENNIRELNRLGFRGRGVVTLGVTPGGPAAEAGMREDDIIIGLDDREVIGVPQLRAVIANKRPGDSMKVRVVRDGVVLELDVKLGDFDRFARRRESAERELMRFGIVRLGYDRNGDLVVADVRAPSEAVQNGFRPGQAILRVDGVEVRDGVDFAAALAAAGLTEGREVEVQIADTNGQLRTLVIE